MIESAKIGAALAAAEESKPFSSAVALNPLPVPYQDHSAERRTPTSIIAICSFLSAVGASSRSQAQLLEGCLLARETPEPVGKGPSL